MLRLASRDLDTRKDSSKLVNEANFINHSQKIQETFPFFAVRLLVPSCWTANSSRTVSQLVDSVEQRLLSAPKIKCHDQAYIYAVKIFPPPEHHELTYSAPCEWSPYEPFAPAFSQVIPQCLACHVLHRCEEFC